MIEDQALEAKRHGEELSGRKIEWRFAQAQRTIAELTNVGVRRNAFRLPQRPPIALLLVREIVRDQRRKKIFAQPRPSNDLTESFERC